MDEESSEYQDDNESSYSELESPEYRSRRNQENKHNNQYTKRSFFSLHTMEGNKTRYEIIYKNVLKEIRRYVLRTLGLKQKNRKKMRSEISERIEPPRRKVQELIESCGGQYSEKVYWVVQCLCDTKFHPSLKREAGEDEYKLHVFDQTYFVMEKFNLISLEHFLKMDGIKELFMHYRKNVGLKCLR